MIKGIMPPITTPFERGEVAYDKLAVNIARWNKTELSGYVVMGSNGESVFLTREEKLKLVEATRKNLTPGRLLIAGTGSDSIEETVALSNDAAERGADYALVLTPSFYKSQMNSAAFVRYFTEAADKIRIPLIIYNVPKFTGVNIEADTVAKLAQHKNIVGLKNSAENSAHMAEIISFVPKDFSVLVGTASVLYPGLASGAAGGILALANIAPEECVELQRLFDAGRHDEASALQMKLIPINKAVTSKYGVPGLKAAMDILGYFGGEPRSPLVSLGQAEREDLKSILKTAGLLD
ncbi:MAG: dihydrodipicolinate synthase family protein [Bacteroidetes bacterium]|nr:dihydrodipicolinate synthase family protein [Bacteroidota bacterium]MCL5738150.1 dihydrodipicolinate synthase family protein [Bacteroidota bacterium]